jgi:plastocyanin
MKPTILRILALVTLLLLAVSATALPVLGQDQSGNTTIFLTGDGYDPEEVTVDVGTQITWRNTSGDELELVAVENWFNPIVITNNSQYSRTINAAGTYLYYTREPGSTGVNPDQGTIEVTDDNTTPTPTPTGTLATTTPTTTTTTTATATSTLVPTLTVIASVSVSVTPTATLTATPQLTVVPTETPPIIYFTATPYPTPGFPNTGGEDVLPPGRAVGIGLLLMLSALAVGIVYRRMRPDIGYRESDYEWRD